MKEFSRCRFGHLPVPALALGGAPRCLEASRKLGKTNKGISVIPSADGGTAFYIMGSRGVS